MLPLLRDELTDLAARRQAGRDELVFGTSTGGKDSPSNVRRRLLAKAVELADARLDELGLEGLPERVTPHSLRRTFASVLVALGENPTYVMGQLGHEKAEFTLSVYSRQMQRRDGETERLRALVEGTLRLEDLERVDDNGQGEGNNGLEPDVAEFGQRAA
jgi:integrase